MEARFTVVSKEKDTIVLEMVNYDNTLLRPLMEELLHDENVEESRYYIKHPLIDNPQITVKVKSGKPQAAVKRSIRRLIKVYEGMHQDLQKELKRLSAEPQKGEAIESRSQ
ncbi:hypothetical protein GCM10007108_15440 [Thermogymnomonas acidicola]|uniref:DNA-directed RNA polymerase subunit Rpo11 n=1 Tax=Thermogymnomonas acidicola TaxID=399579 RepID=A0AA37F9X3_9ARCH|nr:DNA-directed RNA polymerase subunit L [Thermogymnomonas acidicola]GGM78207.1 hypothetical protein GCM10007108_15440 [Thermogymnomonas acidicola]